MSVTELKEEAAMLGMSRQADIREYILKRQAQIERQEEREREREQEREREKEREREREQEKIFEKEREREREKEKEKHEIELQKLQAERDREKQSHDLELARIRAAGSNGNYQNPVASLPKLKLAHFKEGEKIEIFISRFEEAASLMKYDEPTKRVQFMSLFEGKALEVLHRLDENARGYSDMKEALLAAYGLSVDELKKQFYSAKLNGDETASQFAARLKGYFEQWMKKDGAELTVEGIKDLVLRAQYIKSCPEELVARLKMDKVATLDQMKEKADAYFEACSRKKKTDFQSTHSQNVSQGTNKAPGPHGAGAASRPWFPAKNNSTYPPRPQRQGGFVPRGGYTPRGGQRHQSYGSKWHQNAAAIHEPWQPHGENSMTLAPPHVQTPRVPHSSGGNPQSF